ncbi:MAG TPA: glycosyltransferase family 87 protein [Ktedonobacterales bacterium]|nr:glycosyltransferase family 87 protein [Ktedonobacterales bacterium]
MRLRLLSVGYGVLIALCLLVFVLRVLALPGKLSDFCRDYVSVHYFLAGQPVYEPLHCLAQFMYVPAPIEYDAHPPFSILFFLPFSLPPFVPAQLLWAMFSLLAYLAAGYLLLREVGWFSWRGVAAFLLLSIVWQPADTALEAQNVMQVLFLLLVAAWVAEKRGHPRWAGVLLGVAALLKVWPAFMVLGALVLRRWQVVFAGVGTVLAGTALSLIIVGPAAYVAYLGPVQANEQFWVPITGNASLIGAITRPLVRYDTLAPVVSGWTLNSALLLAEAINVCVVGVILFLLWRWYQPGKQASWLLCQALLLTAALLVFPLTMFFTLIALLLIAASLILALRAFPRPPRWWYAVVVLSALPLTQTNWLLWVASMASTRRAQTLLDLPAAGLLLLIGAQCYLFWRARKAEPLVVKEPETPAFPAGALSGVSGQHPIAPLPHHQIE